MILPLGSGEVIAAILKDHQISAIDTANIEDFEGLTFLEAINPLISLRRARCAFGTKPLAYRTVKVV